MKQVTLKRGKRYGYKNSLFLHDQPKVVDDKTAEWLKKQRDPQDVPVFSVKNAPKGAKLGESVTIVSQAAPEPDAVGMDEQDEDDTGSDAVEV